MTRRAQIWISFEQLAVLLQLREDIVITEATSNPADNSLTLYARGDSLPEAEGKHLSRRIPLSELRSYVDE